MAMESSFENRSCSLRGHCLSVQKGHWSKSLIPIVKLMFMQKFFLSK